MNFVVTARRGARALCFHRPSMLSALDQAYSLANAGMDEVLIRDGRGCRRTVAELTRALLAGGRAGAGESPATAA